MGQMPSTLNKNNIKSKIHTKKFMKFRFKKKKKSKAKDPKVQQHEYQLNAITENENDIDAIKMMQDQLAFNSDTFVLNQMMMSVQFFGNFER
jgi:hypothetical protein